MFICAATRIGRCASLGVQVRVFVLRLGGWSHARDGLANEAEHWFGREPVTTK